MGTRKQIEPPPLPHEFAGREIRKLKDRILWLTFSVTVLCAMVIGGCAILLVHPWDQRDKRSTPTPAPIAQTIDELSEDSAPLRMLSIAQQMPTRHLREMMVFIIDRAMHGYVFNYNNQPIGINEKDIQTLLLGQETMSPPNNSDVFWWINQNEDCVSQMGLSDGQSGYDHDFHDRFENEWNNIIARFTPDDNSASHAVIMLADLAHEELAKNGKNSENWKGIAFAKSQNVMVRNCSIGRDGEFFFAARCASDNYTFQIEVRDKAKRSICLTFFPNE